MEKEEKAFVVFLVLAILAAVFIILVVEFMTPKFEGVVSQIIETEEKTIILFEDGKSTSFLRPYETEIVSLEVGDTLKYTEDRIKGAKCRSVRSSSNEAAKRVLYKERTEVKGVIARIEFGHLRSFKYRYVGILFTDGKTKTFSLSSNPEMICAEVGDTIVYKGKRCVSFKPHLTEKE